jgi:Tol biopolymer transport system component
VRFSDGRAPTDNEAVLYSRRDRLSRGTDCRTARVDYSSMAGRIGAASLLVLLCVGVASCTRTNTDGTSGRAQSHARTTTFITSEHVDYWPCFSPDGSRLLFSRRSADPRVWELWIVPVRGGVAHRFIQGPVPVSATRASWSKTNGLIAFTGTGSDQRNSVWLVSSDGTHAHELQLADPSADFVYPSWFPDGRELAAMDVRNLVIKRIDLKDSSVETLTDHASVLTGMPSVSPDGSWIAFAGQRNQGKPYDQRRNSIWLLNVATHAWMPLEQGAPQGRAPAWAPDGSRLAFESSRDLFGLFYAAYVIDRDGTRLQRVTGFPLMATHPVWAPDGRRLAVAIHEIGRRGESRIAVVELE